MIRPTDPGGDEDDAGARLKEMWENVSERIVEYTRRKPFEGLLISFLAGIVLGDLLRRRR